jgi:hypothetical protein
MLPVQQSAQHADDLRVIIGVLALATMAYWRLVLRLLLILVAVATAVGAVALLQVLLK